MLGLVTIVHEHEVGVLVDRLVVVSMRLFSLGVLLGDQPSVSARLQARVDSPTDAAVRVVSYIEATGQVASTALRAVLKEHTWDELLFERRQIEAILMRTIG